MKKVFYFLICFILITAKSFGQTLVDSENCTFESIEFYNQKTKSIISRDEFLTDLDHLCYILSTGYSGYSDMIEKKFNESKFINAVISDFPDETEITTRNFFRSLTKHLLPYINDAHFQLITESESSTLCSKRIVLWTDIYLEQIDNVFVVKHSYNDQIKEGMKYAGDLENLFYYPSKGKNTYRLGLITDKKITNASFAFYRNNVIDFINLDLNDDGSIFPNFFKYKDFSTDKTAYITINNLLLPELNSPYRNGADRAFVKLSQCGKKYNNKKTIILDLRQNQGGNCLYTLGFLYCLYFNRELKDTAYSKTVEDWFNNSFRQILSIKSPVSSQAYLLNNQKKINDPETIEQLKYFVNIDKEDPQKNTWSITPSKDKLFNKKSKFNGQLIILTDRNNVSAGELTIYLAKYIFGQDKVTVIGENSYGMATYWNLFTLRLPCSGIGVHVALDKSYTLDSYNAWHGEGIGILPDWWSDGKDLNQTIFLITQDEEMKERLKDIGKHLM